MNCEICGCEIKGDENTVSLEKTSMLVCSKCAKFGHMPPKQNSISNPNNSPLDDEEEIEFVEDFHKLIQKARNKKKMKLKKFADSINERESVISRVEQGKLIPTVKLAKKLERALDIQILV